MSNKFLKDICRIVGHTLTELDATHNSTTMIFSLSLGCSRCGMKGSANIPYVDLHSRRFSAIERAKSKIEESFKEGKIAGKDL